MSLTTVLFGVVSIVIELPVLTVYAFAADRGRAAYGRHARAFERIAGACLIAAGAKLAMTRT